MTLSPDNVKRLLEIENALYCIEMADRMTREEQDDRRELLNERHRLKYDSIQNTQAGERMDDPERHKFEANGNGHNHAQNSCWWCGKDEAAHKKGGS